MSKNIYLDHAAATTVDERVFQAMLPYFTTQFYNPSSIYLASKKVRKDIEGSRESIARQIGAKPTEVIFTSSATESNNLAVIGVMGGTKDSEIVVSGIEHPGVSVSSASYKVKVAPVNEKGLVDLGKLQDLISGKTQLVSVIFANNEIGTVQPMKKIIELIKQERVRRKKSGNNRPIYLHSDASQLVNFQKIDLSRLKIDLLTISSAKIYGPKGIAMLYVNKDVGVAPIISGGGQEFGLRSGTENVPAIIGFEKAFSLAQSGAKDSANSVSELRDYFSEKLVSSFGDKVIINSSPKYSLPNFLNVSFLGQDGERLVMELDERGVQASTGSACAANKDSASPTLVAIGLSEEYIDSSVRFSLGKSNTKADIDYVLSVLSGII